MSDFGIQDNGAFRRPSIQEIRSRLRDDAQRILGTDVDLSPGSPHGQLLDMHTTELARTWETIQGVYHGVSFEGAYGVQLDRLLALVGVGRFEMRPAEGEVTFRAMSGRSRAVSIPRGTRLTTEGVGDEPAIPFQTTERAVIEAGDVIAENVPIRGLRDWELNDGESIDVVGEASNVAAETITNVDDAISGLHRDTPVINPLPTGSTGERANGEEYNFRVGRDRETDTELKRRYENSLGLAGAATLPAIRAAVLNADDRINAVRVDENNTMSVNDEGIPPKSVRAMVLANGAVNDAIADALLYTAAGGIETYGSESGVAEMRDGEEKIRYFDYASEAPIEVEVNLRVNDTFSDADYDAVTNSIVAYIGGELTTGESVSGTQIGSDIIHHRVWNAATPESVPSIWDSEILIGREGESLHDRNIAIGRDETAVTDPSKITIMATQEEEP